MKNSFSLNTSVSDSDSDSLSLSVALKFLDLLVPLALGFSSSSSSSSELSCSLFFYKINLKLILNNVTHNDIILGIKLLSLIKSLQLLSLALLFQNIRKFRNINITLFRT